MTAPFQAFPVPAFQPCNRPAPCTVLPIDSTTRRPDRAGGTTSARLLPGRTCPRPADMPCLPLQAPYLLGHSPAPYAAACHSRYYSRHDTVPALAGTSRSGQLSGVHWRLPLQASMQPGLEPFRQRHVRLPVSRHAPSLRNTLKSCRIPHAAGETGDSVVRYEADRNTPGLSGTVSAITGVIPTAARRPPPDRAAAPRDAEP